MTVYVDPLRDYGWKLGPSCHMFADDVDELHALALKIGMRRQWFQDKDVPHYDLTTWRRAHAVRLGAVELSMKEAVQHWRTHFWKRRAA